MAVAFGDIKVNVSNVVMQQLIQGLIEKYGFELDGETSDCLVRRWLDQYEELWVRLAIIEALYQGRYKVISVEKILSLWQRRGHAKFHFSYEFERLICRRLPKSLQEFSQQAETESATVKANPTSNALDKPKPTHQQRRKPKKAEQSEEKETQQKQLPSSESINRFTPLFDRSQFYSKLKAVAND